MISRHDANIEGIEVTSSTGLRTAAIVLVALGLILLAIGVIYFAVAADKLPSILGHLSNVTAHRNRRGLASVAAGIVCSFGGALAFYRSRRTGK
jgi:3-dehydroquinate dehydratase